VLRTCRYTASDKDIGCSADSGCTPWTFAFASRDQAQTFRASAYRRVAQPQPSPDGLALPKVITYMSAAEGEVIVNKVLS
jgi:hypothetical protein